MISTPWLSVVVCTYQGEQFLREALESVASQTDEYVELIAVDDGSTDGTLRILQEFSKSLPLRILPVERTGNWIANTNRAMAEARGEFVCLLHQDDRWEPGRLEALRRLSCDYPACDFMVHSSYYINPAGRRVGNWTLPFGGCRTALAPEHFLERMMVQNLLAIPAPIFRRELVLQVGAMREDLWFLADWEFWGRLAAAGQVAVCPQQLTSFRVHAMSQTATRSQDADDLRWQYYQAIDTVAEHLVGRLAPHRIARARRAAALNCEVSIMLALMSHGRRENIGNVLRAAIRLSPAAWWQFWRDSRLHQRVLGRLRAGTGSVNLFQN
jgi:glycosyltransferase involved in cell wall biosynthesis